MEPDALLDGIWYYPYWNIVYRQRNTDIMRNKDFLPGNLERTHIDRNAMLRFVVTGHPPFDTLMFLYTESIQYNKHDFEFSDGSVKLNIQINLNADDRDIFFDIADLLCFARKTCHICNTRITFSTELCTTTLPICNEIKKYTRNEYIRRHIATSGDSFTPAHNQARMVGMWLWDEVDSTGCSIAEAKRNFVKCGYADELGFGESEYTRFHRVYTATQTCISNAKVLPMS